jgi:uncharacterized protein
MGTEETRARIAHVFSAWAEGDTKPFFALVDDDVIWTVIGTTPISGRYESKREFLKGAFGRLGPRLEGVPRSKVVNVLVDGDHVVLQWEGTTRSVTGKPYHQTYCWVIRLRDERIVEVTAYLDTELVSAMFED